MVIPLPVYSMIPMNRQGLQLGFAAVNPQEIKRGVDQLAVALEELTTSQL
jgi:hypothetical protein